MNRRTVILFCMFAAKPDTISMRHDTENAAVTGRHGLPEGA